MNSNKDQTDAAVKRFLERRAEAKEREEAEEEAAKKNAAEKLRQDYLRRTGRKELKP